MNKVFKHRKYKNLKLPERKNSVKIRYVLVILSNALYYIVYIIIYTKNEPAHPEQETRSLRSTQTVEMFITKTSIDYAKKVIGKKQQIIDLYDLN